jgi:hypothetical protein
MPVAGNVPVSGRFAKQLRKSNAGQVSKFGQVFQPSRRSNCPPSSQRVVENNVNSS